MEERQLTHDCWTGIEWVMGIPCRAVVGSCSIYELKQSLISQFSQPGFSVAINAEKIIRARHDLSFLSVIKKSGLPYPDGVAASWQLAARGLKNVMRLNMPVLALDVAVIANLKVGLIGGAPGVAEMAAENAKKNYQEPLQVIFTSNGYQTVEALCDAILHSNADLVLLGTGSPRQEIIASKVIESGFNGFIVPCGGALDLMAGQKKRAPIWVQNAGLESIYLILTHT